MSGEPEKLLWISTGHIANADLEGILHANLATIAHALKSSHFVELNRTGVVIHG